MDNRTPPPNILKNTWKPGQPWIERSLNLRFIGDWGRANFHKICAWLCYEIRDRSGPNTVVDIRSVRHGGWDAIEDVFQGKADLAIVTPACALSGVRDGTGIFEGHPMPSLRAIGVVPQDDRLLFAIDPSFGITTMDELREKRPPIRLATAENNGYHLIGYAAAQYLKAHGIDEDVIKSWGGEIIYSERPEQSLERAAKGEADAVLMEAIMMPWWREVMKSGKVLIPAEGQALGRMEAELNWPRHDLEPNYYPGQTESIASIDFSDFVIVVREDMPEDVAHLLTWCLVEQSETLLQQYRHIPSKDSPVNYPFNPKAMAKSPLPLHPGARRYYLEGGHLDPNDALAGRA